MTLWLSKPITYQCTGYVPQSLIIIDTYFHLFSLCLLKHWIRQQHIDMIPQQCTLSPLDPSLQFSCSPLPMVKFTIVYKALSSLIFSLSSGPQFYAYNSAVTIFYYYIAWSHVSFFSTRYKILNHNLFPCSYLSTCCHLLYCLSHHISLLQWCGRSFCLCLAFLG